MQQKTKSKLNQGMILKALDYSYEKAINGMPGFDSAQEMAESYKGNGKTKVENCNSLIRWQNTKATTSGFVTGLGGLLTMPVAIPANLASVIYVQIRMIAAIAHMGGHDLRDDRVKSLVYVCMAGNTAKDILKDIGIVVGQKVSQKMIANISGKTITRINQAIGFRLLTKFGQRGAINLGKAVPLIGGLIGGTFDGVTTNLIGNTARRTFINAK
ncbi:EcsC family protein [Christiangramia portivictoriae]|uniref:EcsC family protein n=1 Tax=Christiangramia portivictoriae TaxID=326069 RepID=UPI0004200A44|nr:EcsC family protein [Christiangramia portivictoriae]